MKNNKSLTKSYEDYLRGFEEMWGTNPMTREQFEEKQKQPFPHNCNTCKYDNPLGEVFNKCTRGHSGCLTALGRKYWEHDGRDVTEYPEWVLRNH